jgi:hypothetical protein
VTVQAGSLPGAFWESELCCCGHAGCTGGAPLPPESVAGLLGPPPWPPLVGSVVPGCPALIPATDPARTVAAISGGVDGGSVVSSERGDSKRRGYSRRFRTSDYGRTNRANHLNPVVTAVFRHLTLRLAQKLRSDARRTRARPIRTRVTRATEPQAAPRRWFGPEPCELAEEEKPPQAAPRRWFGPEPCIPVERSSISCRLPSVTIGGRNPVGLKTCAVPGSYARARPV